jgi:hypothetical protein
LGLKIKDTTPELDTGPFEWWWPGDDAIDPDASQIEKWLVEGRKTGLVPTGDAKPDTIYVRDLEPYEISYVTSMMQDKTAQWLVFLTVFRIGLIKIDGFRFLRTTVPGNVHMIDDRAVNTLMKESIEIENKKGEVVRRSLPDVIGEHIFKRSFRK